MWSCLEACSFLVQRAATVRSCLRNGLIEFLNEPRLLAELYLEVAAELQVNGLQVDVIANGEVG